MAERALRYFIVFLRQQRMQADDPEDERQAFLAQLRLERCATTGATKRRMRTVLRYEHAMRKYGIIRGQLADAKARILRDSEKAGRIAESRREHSTIKIGILGKPT